MTGIWGLLLGTLAGMAFGLGWLQAKHHRRVRLAFQAMDRASEDSSLAKWCRGMSLTVVTHTGTVFSTTLAELAASDVPQFRSWNIPIQVVIWSADADKEMLAELPTPDPDGIDA